MSDIHQHRGWRDNAKDISTRTHIRMDVYVLYMSIMDTWFQGDKTFISSSHWGLYVYYLMDVQKVSERGVSDRTDILEDR